MKVGIAGFSSSGKSTVFHWLTGVAPDPSRSQQGQIGKPGSLHFFMFARIAIAGRLTLVISRLLFWRSFLFCHAAKLENKRC